MNLEINKIRKLDLHKGRPFKSLVFGKKSTGGRNNTGRITAKHRGGGHKRLLRIIDTHRTEFWNQFAEVVRIEKDPGRSGFIALIKYPNDEHRYILAPKDLKVGTKIIAGDTVEPVLGNTTHLKSIPQGLLVHNVELVAGNGGQIAKSAGCYARIAGRDGEYIILKLKSGELRKFPQTCLATIGMVSNEDHFNKVVGKAGASRWLGIRPWSRGIAKNPVSHPMGGRTNGGRIPCTPQGRPTRGMKTRRNRVSDRLILSRRNRK